MLALALIALLAQLPGPNAGQAVKREARGPDSTRILRSARSAQRAFEAFRRVRLPIIGSGGGGHDCDAVIGRYCHWRGSETDNPKAPPEAREVVEHRNMLIKEFENAAIALPGDEWIAGQRVRYLVEAGRADDAWQYATNDCESARTWCLLLAGYAAHRAEHFAQADSAYTVALAGMEPAERCRWLDVSPLLDDDLDDRFKGVPCEQREQFVRRVLLIGAPLYSVSTTDLFTEHLARLTLIRILEKAATPDGSAWASDLREVVIRYGWAGWFSRSLAEFGSQQTPPITWQDSGMLYNYLPPLVALDDVSQVRADDWKLNEAKARTGYAPSYLKTMHVVPSQIARFRRGDSTLIVAAWDARRDPMLVGRTFDAALVLAGSETVPVTVTRQSGARATGHISVTGKIDSGFVSLELLSREDGAAGRARIGLGGWSTGRIALSDILLYRSTDTPNDLTAVQDSAIASGTLPPSKKIGVYWETYGLNPQGERVHVTLTVEAAPAGVLRKVAERLRFADPTSSLRIQWDLVARPEAGVAGRGVQVNLGGLRRGRYKMQLAVNAGGDVSLASREVDVP